jgi:hypothetical protein
VLECLQEILPAGAVPGVKTLQRGVRCEQASDCLGQIGKLGLIVTDQ